jgi:hypothetical protein
MCAALLFGEVEVREANQPDVFGALMRSQRNAASFERDLAKSEGPVGAIPLSLLRQGVTGSDWTRGRSGGRFRCPSFWLPSLASMDLHPPYVFGDFSEPNSGLCPVGDPESDIQPRSPIDHGYRSHGFQFL